jgi:hypothetical protein
MPGTNTNQGQEPSASHGKEPTHVPSARTAALARTTGPHGTLRFWVARPTRVGPMVGPPLGIWRGLVDFNHLVWKR